MSATWKRDFASGLIVLTPLLVTLAVLAWIYNFVKEVPIDLKPAPLRVAVTLVVFVLLVFAVGYLMRTAVGVILERALDDVMNKLPGLRVIYNASKTAAETALSTTESLQAPVSVETWPGMRMTAFKTGETTPDGRDVLFLPTAPNVTTGFVIEIEPDQYDVRDETVEEALTRVLSAGFGDSNGHTAPGEMFVDDVVSPDDPDIDDPGTDDETTDETAIEYGSVDDETADPDG
ncbi:DUF502 domain-containing protein [Halococcoides cellulosivorans]|uniref:DUF502 domain-containing protein n=1 Tax=Halococcoides cellulosivorans TaxID=1679096 RepID=A0A2R4WZQ6_9EURY|nr:DUF502 domain-containing protein [Halococcoides cellulosivorans]AWB27007.1 hypothetical protein HARCEL1_04425 [Halococcoides cellulosivorans]